MSDVTAVVDPSDALALVDSVGSYGLGCWEEYEMKTLVRHQTYLDGTFYDD